MEKIICTLQTKITSKIYRERKGYIKILLHPSISSPLISLQNSALTMVTTTVGIKSLGRVDVSLILSHLSESEGVSLLITCKRFALHLLPLFRLPPANNGGLLVQLSSALLKKKQRYRFIPYPAQDPEMLLQRLNTRRLRKRLIQRNNADCSCYESNKTTRQLALVERLGSRQADQELLRFLAPKEGSKLPALLVSYPRSGNTLLRSVLERLTGIVTGSDNRPDRKLSRDLAIHHNLVGEGVVSSQHCQVVKTHYPERSGSQIKASRAILLVRNPYDAIDSYWNLNLTNTHTETVTDDIYKQFHDTFEDLAMNEMHVWMKFHEYWLNASIPILVVRFEDLIGNMEHELTRIADFLSLDPSRIPHACGRGDHPSQLGSYRPRTTGKKPYGKSLDKGRYSNDMIEKFHEMAQDYASPSEEEDETLLQYFGYDIVEQDFPNNFLNGNVHPIVDDAALRKGSTKSMVINAGYQIRPSTDIYGRSMKQWRLDRTNNDQEPFPIVNR
jgi:hypothetical protein